MTDAPSPFDPEPCGCAVKSALVTIGTGPHARAVAAVLWLKAWAASQPDPAPLDAA